MNEGQEHGVEFVEAGEHAPIDFEPAEEPFHLVAATVKSAVERQGRRNELGGTTSV